MAPETSAAIVTLLQSAEANHAADATSSSGFVAFQGTPRLYADLLGCRSPGGSWSIASAGAEGLAEVYRRAQVSA